jgi:hypothetical protein
MPASGRRFLPRGLVEDQPMQRTHLVSRLASAALGLVLASFSARGEDGAKPLKEGPPKELAADVAKALSGTGYQVTAGGKAVCDVWLAKEWQAKAKFTPTLSMLYPIESGELIGAIRYPKKAGDFRNQEIRAGVYTIRFGLQPEDGNHVGTSMTRDFLVLLPAAKDAKPARIGDVMALFKQSAAVTGATHPAILAMLAVPEDGQSPAVRHLEDRELWSLRLSGKAKAGDKTSDLPIEFVIVGHAPE